MKQLGSTHILSKIVEAKRLRLQKAKMRVPDVILNRMSTTAAPAPSFRSAMESTSVQRRIIAEVKKASPSKGVFRKDFAVEPLVQAYTSAGAAAISVVTEEDFFQGELGWISQIRKLSSLPILRKDFVFDPYQVHETRSSGASALLLIAAMLRPDELKSLLELTRETKLDALVEVHDEHELAEALEAGADIIGVNNRDLKTFQVDVATSLRLAKLIPEDRIFIV